MLEYSLVVALIALVVIAVVTVVGRRAAGALCSTSGALTGAGRGGCVLYSAGLNNETELANGNTTSSSALVPVTLGAAFVDVVAGTYNGAGLRADGTVFTWGYGGYGELGYTPATGLTPGQVPSLTGIVAVSAGNQYMLAAGSDGSVWAWGTATHGQLGDNRLVSAQTIPVRVLTGALVPLTDVIAVSANYESSLALKRDGTVWSWGANAAGELGDGTTFDQTTAVQVMASAGTPFTGVSGIGGGFYSAYAVKADGTVWSWGAGTANALGTGPAVISQPRPVQVLTAALTPLTGIASVAKGSGYHGLALSTSGAVYAWGSDAAGETGDTTTIVSTPYAKAVGLTNVAAVAGGGFFSLALLKDGTVSAWGQNNSGQLGLGDTVDRGVPTSVPNVSGVVAIAGGYHHASMLATNLQ